MKVDHLRIFGCPVYVHVPDPTRRKLEPKAVKGVFVGYPSGTKGYKIFFPDTRKMASSRDVQFLENSFCSIDGTRAIAQDPASVPHFDKAVDESTDPCVDVPAASQLESVLDLEPHVIEPVDEDLPKERP